MLALGDSHNFGRRVTEHGRWIHKPRPTLWEHTMLSRSSSLRKLFDRIAPDHFSFLPTLSISHGKVERIRLAPLHASKDNARKLAAIVGRSLALWSWMGVADLHWENLALGKDDHGRIIFGPLDIEMMLADLSLPTQTKLIAEAGGEYDDVCRHAAGVRRALPYLGKPISAAHLLTITSAYRETLDLLDEHAPEIARVFDRLPHLRTTPIRVLLRATSDYVRARSEPIWPPLLDAESEQLARGDIPYFFRLYGEPGIRFHRDARLRNSARLPSRGDVPQLAPLLSLARKLRSPKRRKLRHEGLLSVIGAFDHRTLDGRHRMGDLEIVLTARRIKVDIAGERLEAPRNLRAIVGSAYLPCRCGEVYTVLA